MEFMHILYLLKPLNNSKVYISEMFFACACTKTTFTNFNWKFGYFCFNLEPYYPHNSDTVRDRENIIMNNVSNASLESNLQWLHSEISRLTVHGPIPCFNIKIKYHIFEKWIMWQTIIGMDGQNTITKSRKHIQFSQLKIKIFKILKKLKGKQLYNVLDFDLKIVITTLK